MFSPADDIRSRSECVLARSNRSATHRECAEEGSISQHRRRSASGGAASRVLIQGMEQSFPTGRGRAYLIRPCAFFDEANLAARDLPRNTADVDVAIGGIGQRDSGSKTKGRDRSRALFVIASL